MQGYTEGSVIGGKFRIERELGEGGFSSVFLATQLGMERPVALKVMKIPAHAQDNQSVHEKLVRRFDIEAKIISQLGEPSTITVYDYGESELGDLYMALEYVRGRSLADEVATHGKVAPARVAHIVAQVLKSLREAHELGIIHRDIKPANIMIFDHMSERDRVKVLDFGIAKLFSEEQQPMDNLTRAGMLIGTPRYMAPELVRGEGFGPQVDLYALGLTAYELLTGEQAVTGTTPMAVLSRQIDAESVVLPPDPAIPEPLRRFIDKLTAKDLSQRFESAQQALDALAPMLRPGALSAASTLDTMDGLTKPAPPARATLPAHSIEQPAPGAQRIVAAAISAAILLVAGVIGVAYWNNAPSAPATVQLVQPSAPPAQPPIKSIEGIDRIAAELERSTHKLQPLVKPEPAPEPTLAERLAATAGAGAERGAQKPLAPSARRVEDSSGKKPKTRQPDAPDDASPAAPAQAAPEQPAAPDQPPAPQEPVAPPEPAKPAKPIETRIEHIEIR